MDPKSFRPTQFWHSLSPIITNLLSQYFVYSKVFHIQCHKKYLSTSNFLLIHFLQWCFLGGGAFIFWTTVFQSQCQDRPMSAKFCHPIRTPCQQLLRFLFTSAICFTAIKMFRIIVMQQLRVWRVVGIVTILLLFLCPGYQW